MTARIGDFRCLSCGHDPDVAHPTCGCVTCHLVHVPADLRPHRLSEFPGPVAGTDRSPTVPLLGPVGPASGVPLAGRILSGVAPQPNTRSAVVSPPTGRGAPRTPRHDWLVGLLLTLAAVFVLAAWLGSRPGGWHESPWDTVLSAVVACLCAVGAGLVAHQGDRR